jgi:hypothetical protein
VCGKAGGSAPGTAPLKSKGTCFNCLEVLPEVALACGLVERSDLTAMEVPEESF